MGRLLRLVLFGPVVFIVLVVLIAVFTRRQPAPSPIPGRPAALEAEDATGIAGVGQAVALGAPGGTPHSPEL
jgi:hypothetical protein